MGDGLSSGGRVAIRAVLFDMDGVLLDTEPLYTVAYDRILSRYGAALDPQTKLSIMGRAAIESAAFVIERFGLPMTPESFLEERKPILTELFGDAPAMPGAAAFVESLYRRGVPMAVATSTHRSLFETKTAGHPWFARFGAIVCGDDRRVARPKPAPDIFLAAARGLGVPSEACVVFEDSPTGVVAARAAGGGVVAFVPRGTDRARFEGADQIVHRFEDAVLDFA